MQIKKSLQQLFVYLIVGAGATVVEWLAFYILNEPMAMGYMAATTLAFILSTFANWGLGKLLMFRGTGRLLKELSQIYLTAIFGLLFNLAIMYVCVEWLHTAEMAAKVIATGIVFFWNFLVRKLFIYKI